MKKILIPLVLLVIGKAINAQTEKKEPPPPPPKMETAKPERPIIKDEKIKPPPVITVTGKMAGEFYKRNPTVSNISRKGNILILKMKDGTIEKYDMSNKEEDKMFTEKYGVSPIPPPPPSPKKLS